MTHRHSTSFSTIESKARACELGLLFTLFCLVALCLPIYSTPIARATSFFGAQGIGPADNCYRDSTQNMRPDGSVRFGRGDGATHTLDFTHSRSYSRDLNNSSSFAALCTMALRLLLPSHTTQELPPHTTPVGPTTKDQGAINTTCITRALMQDAMKKGFCQVLKNSEYRVCCAQRHLPARGVGRTLNLLIRPST